LPRGRYRRGITVFEKEGAFMEILSLSIAVLALIIALAAYYRSGSKKHILPLERELERLSKITRRATDSVAASVRAAYERNIRTISGLQSRVAALRKEAIEEVREDLRMMAQTLDGLAERDARELKELKDEVSFSLMEAELGLRLTVDDAKAYLKLIEAKRELVLARLTILRNDLVEAEIRVESAFRYIEEAQSLALGHHESIAALQEQAQQMLVAVRTKASTMKASIDALIERSKRLSTEMSGLEAKAKTAA
jgi:hypothetical protein